MARSPPQRQGEIIQSLRPGTIGAVGGSTDEVAEAVVQKMLAIGLVQTPK
jgi:hypothetical protein